MAVVAALTKVEPASGFIDLAADVSGIVVERLKNGGGPVKKGEVIFRLDEETQTLDITSARQEIVTQQAREAASQADIR